MAEDARGSRGGRLKATEESSQLLHRCRHQRLQGVRARSTPGGGGGAGLRGHEIDTQRTEPPCACRKLIVWLVHSTPRRGFPLPRLVHAAHQSSSPKHTPITPNTKPFQVPRDQPPSSVARHARTHTHPHLNSPSQGSRRAKEEEAARRALRASASRGPALELILLQRGVPHQPHHPWSPPPTPPTLKLPTPLTEGPR